MGYQTVYSLNICDKNRKEILSDSLIDSVTSAIDALEIFENGDVKNGFTGYARWYEHEEELGRISAEFPDLLFCLHGEGDEATDIWDKYFKGGKIQRCPAVITIADFDESLLETIT